MDFCQHCGAITLGTLAWRLVSSGEPSATVRRTLYIRAIADKVGYVQGVIQTAW